MNQIYLLRNCKGTAIIKHMTKGEVVLEHTHSRKDVLMVVDGALELTLDGTLISLRKESRPVVIGYRVKHGYKALENTIVAVMTVDRYSHLDRT